MKNELLQKDINILELIEMKSKRYFEGTFEISELIDYFESYLNQLTYIDEPWKKKFKSLWGSVETVYAIALSIAEDSVLDKDYEFTDEDRKLVNEAITCMQQMASEKLPELRALKDKLFPRDPYEL